MQAKKANAEFADQVEKNKVDKLIQQRKQKSSNAESSELTSQQPPTKKFKAFKQHRSMGIDHGEQKIDRNVLVSILGKKNSES